MKISKDFLLVVVTGWASRGFSAIISLVNMSLLLTYLSTDEYALFAIVTSIVGWCALADCGLGSSLQNQISYNQVHGIDDNKILSTCRGIIFPLFYIMTGVSIVVSAFVYYMFIQHRITGKNVGFSLCALEIIAIIAVSAAVAGVGYRVFFARNIGYIYNLAQIAVSTVSIITLFAVTKNVDSNKIFWCLFCVIAPAALISIITAFFVFNKQKSCIDSGLLRVVSKQARSFFVYGVLSNATQNTDYLIMSVVVNSVGVSQYSVGGKFFGLLFFMYNAILWAMWPIWAELYAKKEWKKLDQSLQKGMCSGIVIIGVGTLILWFTMPWVLKNVFHKEDINLSGSTILLFGVYFSLRVIIDSYLIVLQSFGKAEALLKITILQVVLCAIGQYFLGVYLGVDGILLGSILSIPLFSFYLLPRIYKSKKHNHN